MIRRHKLGILIVGDNLQAVMEGRQEVGGGRSPNAEVSHTVDPHFLLKELKSYSGNYHLDQRRMRRRVQKGGRWRC